MATNNHSQDNSGWPDPKFRFEVDFGAGMAAVSFQEVSGMDIETQIIEYRKSNSPLFATVKMPGIAKPGNITMKKGIFVNDNAFWNWQKELAMNTIKKRNVTIKLLDEKGKATMQWHLNSAWPIKITSTDLKATGNEVAIESLELAHEGITLSES